MNEGFCGLYLQNFPEDYRVQQCKTLLLADGTSLSIQAGLHHYCSPKKNCSSGDYNFYDSFEIGFPSRVIPELLEYAQEPDNPTETVYPYVPKDLIRGIITNTGGVVGFK
jgi:hypothetical protein